jgi:hypothetical protein
MADRYRPWSAARNSVSRSRAGQRTFASRTAMNATAGASLLINAHLLRLGCHLGQCIERFLIMPIFVSQEVMQLDSRSRSRSRSWAKILAQD